MQSTTVKHAVLGTAGHIDHGKTALIKALTGTECDTHKEEKKRGITINLGFTHLESDEVSLSVVDMPGHADFIKTMVAGASGIDIFLLVIAADSGIMPQTIEHLQILKVLGIDRGVIAITKQDLADEDILFLLEEEVCELKEEFPFLNEAPIVHVSSKTGFGIEELKLAISKKAESMKRVRKSEIFRMYIDRLFTIKGVGTIIAGSILGGTLTKDDTLIIYPGSGKAKIRRMERHGEEILTAEAGDRVSINLTGVKREELSRGMQISKVELQESTLFDCEITMFRQENRMKSHWQGIIIIGSCELQCKIHTITKKESSSESKVLAQISLETPTVLQPNETFVIRNSSDDRSVGGGRVIDPHPLHHRKRTESLIEQLEGLAGGDLTTTLLAQMRGTQNPVYIKDVVLNQNITEDEFIANLKPQISADITLTKIGGENIAYKKEFYRQWQSNILGILEKYESDNPLNRGMNRVAIISALGLEQSSATLALVKNILIKEKDRGNLLQKAELWLLSDETRKKDDGAGNQVKVIDDYIRQTREHPVSYSAIVKRYSDQFNTKVVRDVLNHLIENKLVFLVDDIYIHKSIAEKYLGELKTAIEKSSEGISLPEFRDYISQGRKFAQLIMELSSQQGNIKVDKESMKWRFL